MNTKNLLYELQTRGFIAKVSNIFDLNKNIVNTNISVYCGFDPTADSLHVGHLLPLLCLRWFQKYGHKIVILIGYATSLIGDPSFKNKERHLMLPNLLLKWEKNIIIQINKFFEDNNFNKPIIINNYDWFKKINMIVFLRDIGKLFSVNNMINKKSVKNRINRIDQGISFTEFSYSILQAYDFLQLYKIHQVILQIGGSDQWGNIISGVNLVRKMYHDQVFGLTIPLLTQSNGTKFGKTENNQTIWLSSDRTSPYTFYQFWLNIDDKQVYSFLKLFTFLDLQIIEEIHNTNSRIQDVKVILADYITAMVHGKKKLYAAKRITHNLFCGKIINLRKSDFLQLQQDGIFCINASVSQDLKTILINTNFAVSRSDAHRLIIGSGLKINGRRERNPDYQFTNVDKLFKRFTILSKGKKKHVLLSW
ncbi:tyrosine--tRNA ligase [Buchnera aphidicola]|uniref:Tyrosine--tRNA ligase n=1 Tax=Buchnera aphidicola (Sarucallis kahawaluokalani) TaxID=1241878 RepID=A0A4D6Y8B4_9GAMM|nr:tyrosine--tRNA ligase [Buchnera aphidicola]QCI25887.1 tyrosine--tRNA ligase [Buchnera aphidicola (Sarucallis kahawaluokalani)]